MVSWPLLAIGLLFHPLGHYGYSGFPPVLHGGFAWVWTTVSVLSGIAGLVWTRSRETALSDEESIRCWLSWPLLGIILCVGAWFRLCHWGTPIGPYLGDNAFEILDSANIWERSDHPLVFLPGGREPLYDYLMVPFLMVFHDWNLLQVHQLASACFDLITIVLLYGLGKEVGGVRAGLWAAALGSVSRTLVGKSLLGLRFLLLPTLVTLALWVLVRLIKKPSRSRFIQWAEVMVLGVYTYTSFRAFWVFMILGLLVWILAHPGDWKLPKSVLALTCFVLLFVLGLSLWASGSFGMDHRLWERYTWTMFGGAA